MLFWVPLHLLTMMLGVPSMMRLRETSPSTSSTSSDIAMTRHVLLVVNLMRGSHYTLFRGSRDNHACRLLILNRSLSILNLFF